MKKKQTIGGVISHLINRKNLTNLELADKLNMNIQTLKKIFSQSFASDELISKISDALELEPNLLENFKFSNIIINQIAAANGEGTVTQSANLSEKTAQLYERIIEQQNTRIMEKDEVIRMLKHKIEAFERSQNGLSNCVKTAS